MKEKNEDKQKAYTVMGGGEKEDEEEERVAWFLEKATHYFLHLARFLLS